MPEISQSQIDQYNSTLNAKAAQDASAGFLGFLYSQIPSFGDNYTGNGVHDWWNKTDVLNQVINGAPPGQITRDDAGEALGKQVLQQYLSMQGISSDVKWANPSDINDPIDIVAKSERDFNSSVHDIREVEAPDLAGKLAAITDYLLKQIVIAAGHGDVIALAEGLFIGVASNALAVVENSVTAIAHGILDSVRSLWQQNGNPADTTSTTDLSGYDSTGSEDWGRADYYLSSFSGGGGGYDDYFRDQNYEAGTSPVFNAKLVGQGAQHQLVAG